MTYRQTKILATLGPASNTKKMVRDLFHAGANAFRLNFSHGSYSDIKKLVKILVSRRTKVFIF
ncbi:MAG: pyruvate kinase, partial [Alphaproteobacteria bacterium]